MRIAIVSFATLGLVSQALSQAPVVTTTSEADRLVPARNVNEGGKRYEAAPIDYSTYRSMPEPDGDKYRPVPSGFQHQGVSYDSETGVETYHPLSLFDPMRAPESMPSSITGALVEGISPEGIWSTPVSRNSQNYPFSPQVRMFFTQSGSNFRCSGTMIGPKTVITAGHCVNEGNGGAWSTNVRVAPAWDGDSDRYGEANGIRLASFSAWTQNGSYDGDMGYIHLDRPIGFLSQWLGYGFTTTNSFWTNGNETFYMVGYPGTRPAGHASSCSFSGAPDQLYQGDGVYSKNSATSFVITTRVSSGWCYSGGMSGTGIYYFDGSNDRIVVGNHSHRCYTCSTNTIGTARMSQGKFDFLNSRTWYSDTTLDLVPLDVNADASPRAGSRLGTFDYLVGNASDVNPASANYTTDVYLSTNDNISTADTLIQTHSYTYDFGVRSTRNTNASSFIRVDPATKPRIPLGTAPGTYWVGVIIGGDGVSGNNDTDGWDAAEINVGRAFPNLPSTSLSIPRSGVHISFEGLRATPPYFAVNRLDGDSLRTSTDAWVNFGQLATCSDPFQGTRNLELGVEPGELLDDPDPISALVIRLNGQNGVAFQMDFQLIDYGEEDDEFDGVWISQDGNDWQRLVGPWGPLATYVDRWESIRGVRLTGATSVNTDNNFYLAFAAQDNFPHGGADGIGIDDIRIHQRLQPTMTLSDFYSPATGKLHLHASTPSSFGCFVYSLRGAGPVSSPFGTVLLSPPWATHVCVPTNRSGEATVDFPIPRGFVGFPIWWQALDFGSLGLTNGLGIRIK